MPKNSIKLKKLDIESVFPIHFQHHGKKNMKKENPFDELSFEILSYIARNEGCTGWSILNGLGSLTIQNRRLVDYRIEKHLLLNGFVWYKERKSHQGITKAFKNIKEKSNNNKVRKGFQKGKTPHPKEYFLTFKGFLASLAYCKLKDNYIVKKWISNIDNPNTVLAGKILEFLEIEITFFLKFHALKKIPLHLMDKMERWVTQIQHIGLDSFEINEVKELESLRRKSSIRRADLDEEFRFCDHPKLKKCELEAYVAYWQYTIGGICNKWSFNKNIKILNQMIRETK